MREALLSTWDMMDRLERELGVLEMDRRVHRICHVMRKGEPCKQCPMRQMEEVQGVEEPCQRLCYGLAAEALAYAHGAVHPREVRP